MAEHRRNRVGRTMGLGVLATAMVLAIPAVGAAEPTHREVDRHVDMVGHDLMSDVGEVAVFPNSFGRWSLDQSFTLSDRAPREGTVVAIDSMNRPTRLDLITGAFEVGEALPGPATVLEASFTGEFAFVAWSAGGSGSSGMFRYGVENMGGAIPVVVPGPVSALDSVPNTFDNIVVATAVSIGMLQGGSMLSDVVASPGNVDSLVVANDVIAYATAGPSLYQLDLGPDGVMGIATVGAAPALSDLRLGAAGHLVIDTDVLDVGTTDRRPGTEFELSYPDPTLGVAFQDGLALEDRGEAIPTSVIFDSATGDVLERDEPRCFFLSGGPGTEEHLLLGDGFKFDGVNVVNIPDACGSYGEFTPVDPARVLDSRSGRGMSSARQVRAGETLRVKIHGLAGVPETGVESVVLNVTALRQRGVGAGKNFVSVWPAGFPRPTVSNLNIGEREVVGNMVTVSTSAGGFVDIYSDRGTVDLTVDVMGYFAAAIAPSGSRFRKSDNTRILDTRGAARLGATSSLTVDVRSRGSGGTDYGPNDIVAAVVNVTAVQPTEGSYFAVYPTGSSLPDASSANFPGRTNTNRLVTVKTNDGQFDIWNSVGNTDVTVDLVGVYIDNEEIDRSASGRFVGLVPFRDVDTRINSPFDGDGSLTEEGLITIPGWRNNINLVTNLTAIRPTTTGFFSSGPWDGDFDSFYRTSSLNFGPGSVIANQSIIRASGQGEIGVFNRLGRTHLAIDVFGYYTTNN